MKKLIPILLVLVMLASILTGCNTYGNNTSDPTAAPDNTNSGSTETEAPAGREKTKEGYGSVNIAYTEPNTLNLLTSQSNLDQNVFYLISVMLYRPFGDKMEPEMVTNLEKSEDGRKYTYTLREAYYTDGTQVTAQDFVYYILNSTMARQSTITNCLVNGKAYMAGECEASEVGCYAENDTTLVIELAEDAAGFDPEMDIYPLKQSYAEEKGDALGGTAQDFLCSGPYIITDWTYGASLTFTKNPDYWNAENSFQIKDVKIIHGADSNAQYNMFVAGEADILASIGDDIADKLKDYSTHYMTGALQGLEFNTTGMYFDGTTFAARDPEVTALLSNKNFRMALSYALDRETIVGAVDPKSVGTTRYFDNAHGLTEGKKFSEEFAFETAPLTGDEAKAVEYLNAALSELGYGSVSELPTVKYLTFESATFRLMAETIQSEWKRVLGITNIEIELKPIQDAIMSMVYMNYDIYYQATSVEANSQLTCMQYWMTGGGMSDVMQAGAPFSSIYSNSDFDAIVTQASSEFDEAKRFQLVAQAEEIFLNDYIFIPVMNQGGYTAVSDRIAGYVVADLVPGIMLNDAYVVEGK